MAISRCKRCGAVVYDGAPLCTECNERHNEVYNTRLWSDKKKPRQKRNDISYFTILMIVIGFFTILPITIKLIEGINPISKSVSPVDKRERTLEFIGEVKTTRDEYSIIFEGIVKNNSTKEVSMVTVSFNLLDKDGNVLEVVSDYLPNLKAGSTWKFNTRSYTQEAYDNAVKSEINQLSGF